ncbi:MAG: serine hydrolase [Ktedonobacterales bacterium]|nr:serine hydrolase [Ktedonobacterales bacterium]
MSGDAGISEAFVGAGLDAKLATLLATLGGETALAARRFSQAGGRTSMGAGQTHVHEPTAPSSPTVEAITLRADMPLPAAGLARLPIAVELLRRVDLGQFALDEPFTLPAAFWPVNAALAHLTLGDLCGLMLSLGDNAAANALLDLVGMGEVNETISRLTLPHTRLARHFQDPTARAARRENVTAASDMLTLLALIRGNTLPGATHLRAMLAAQQRLGEVAAALPPQAQLAHLGGALDDMVHDAGLLTGPGGACVYCVLTAKQADTSAARAVLGHAARLLWQTWCAA